MEKNNKVMDVEDIHTYYGESYVIQGLSLYVAGVRSGVDPWP